MPWNTKLKNVLEYIKRKENKLNFKIEQNKFRCKDKGRGFFSKITFKNKKDKLLFGECEPYYSMFSKGENLRELCYNYKYSNLNRMSDITLGDFWGIEKVCKFPNKIRGVLAVLVNSSKRKR